jgi:hypothetical protein
MTDAALDARLFPHAWHEAGPPAADRARLGDYSSRAQAQHVTLSILWDDITRNPKDYRYWMRHYGPVWPIVQAAKKKHDPKNANVAPSSRQ